MKGTLITGFVAVGLIMLFVNVVGADLYDGLILYFPFDQDSGQKVMDQSGMKNNGDIQGGAKIVNGKFGKGVEFDGKAQFILVPYSDSLNATDAVTMASWVNPAKPATQIWLYYLISKWNYHAGNGRCYFIGLLDGAGITFFISKDGTDAGMTRLDAGALEYGTNKWQHVAGVYDGKEMRIYIDGVEAGKKAAEGKIFVDTNKDDAVSIAAGSSGKEAAARFTGVVDEVAIYKGFVCG